MARRTVMAMVCVGALAGAAVIGFAVDRSGSAEARPAPAAAAVVEHTIHSFDLDTSPAAMVAFSGNELVVEGTVRDQGAARVITPKAAGGDLTYVYRPVNLVVTAVHKGNAKVGEVIALRIIGGEAAGHRTVVSDAAPADTYQTGKQLLVFGVGKLDAGDGVVAVTPNATYVVSDGQAVNAVDSKHRTTVAGLRTQLKKAAK